ncbi:MAG: hypothetical protein IPJ65_00995 [Archangiaceae bacterium]|nr:hypothetical protein [Archangiaceae bacterium]
MAQALQSLLPEAVERAEPVLRPLMRRELAQGLGLNFTRLDVVCPDGAPHPFKLLEAQAGDPSAMGWTDALCDAMGLPATLMPAHRRAFERLTEGRRIAFVVKRGSVVESDHRLLAEHYTLHGWQAEVVAPAALEPERYDAVFRDALDELLPTASGPRLLDAALRGQVMVLNPFVAALGDDKALLEPLSTPSRWPTETAKVLSACVPCTRVVAARRCDWEGKEVDLAEHLFRSREGTVLKPVDGYGGFGVTLGPFVTEAQWQVALEGALASPGRFVAQAHVPLPRAQVSTLDGALEAHVVDSLWLCPELAGGFYRASVSPVVNVHQGGGLAPISFTAPFL